MPTQHYLPDNEAGVAELLATMDANLPGALATKYGVTTDQLERLHQGRVVWDWFMTNNTIARQWCQGLTEDRDKLFDGPAGADVDMPGLPALTAVPTVTIGGVSVPAKIEPLFFEFLGRLVAQIKDHANYDPADGQTLKIVGAEIPPPDPSIVPIVEMEIGTGGQPVVVCKKTPFEGYTVRVSVDGGPAIDAGFSTKRKYPIPADKVPMPPAGTAKVWTITVQYRYKGGAFGQWSQPVQITVRG